LVLVGHLADVHLGTRKYRGQLVFPPGYEVGGEFSSLLSRDVWEVLGRGLEELWGRGVGVVVLSGDVFDVARPDNRELARAVRFFRGWAGRGLRFVAVPGDHDTPGLRDHTPLHTLAEAVDGFFLLGAVPLGGRLGREGLERRVDGAVFYGVPYVRGVPERRRGLVARVVRLIDAWAREVRGPRVVLAHFGLEPFTHESDALGRPGDLLPRSVSYVALGHVHRRVVVTDFGVPFAYPGSLVPMSVEEVRLRQERGPLLVELPGDGGPARVESVPVEPARAYLEVTASAGELASAVAERVRGLGQEEPPLVHVHLLAGRGESVRELRRVLERVARDLHVVLRLASIRRPGARLGASSGVAAPVEGSPGGVELAVLEELVGSRRVAEKVLELKAALVAGDMELAGRVVLELAGEEYRGELERLVARLYRAPRPSSRPARRRASARGPRGRGLDSFF